MKMEEITKKDMKDLRKELLEKRDDLAQLSFASHTKQLPDVREIRSLKKDIARILTVMKQKELEGDAKEVKKDLDNDNK